MGTDAPKRRCFRFSLRTLLIVMTLFAVTVGWIGSSIRGRMQQARDDERSVAEWTGPGPRLVGYDTWERIEELDFSNTRVTDAELSHLKGFANLQRLSLHGTPITDAGLEHLKGLQTLHLLILNRTKVTDADLDYLKGMTNLRFLSLEGTNVTDEGVEKLQQALPNCKIIH